MQLINGGTSYRIKDCDTVASGSLEIPATYNGLPITNIGDEAFRDCALLTSVTIGDNVTTIGNWVFAYCEALTSVSIGNSVTTIGGWAFLSCTSLTNVTIGNSVPNIGPQVFSGTSISYDHVENGLNFLLNESATAAFLVDASAASGNVIIPGQVLGAPVLSVSGFYDNRTVTSVSIPDGATTISYWAFYGCNTLMSVTIGESVTTIGDWAFKNCNSLTSVTIPDSVVTIGEAAFDGCDSLKSLTIPDSVTSIGEYAFRYCTSLMSITIGNSVATIGEAAFNNCYSLTNIDVAATNPNYASISGTLFNKDLTTLVRAPGIVGSYTIPDSVTTIGSYAFNWCISLTNVIIPDSVTTIGERAFRYCTSLTSATFEGDAPGSFGSEVFDSTASNFTIYYLNTSSGFTSPKWKGYNTIKINTTLYPRAFWLMSHAILYDTDISSDLNGDGVSLLGAYALNLDPNENLSLQLPQSVIGAGTLEMTFFAGRTDVTYHVEVCGDLSSPTWTETGVTLSELDPDGYRTASVPLSADPQYMRIRVDEM